MAWFRKTRAQSSPDPNAESRFFREAIALCPRCELQLLGHRFKQLACWPITGDNRSEIEEFLKKAKAHDWTGVARYQRFDPMMDVLLAYVIACPSGEKCVVFTKSSFELYASELMVHWERLESFEDSALMSLIDQCEWKEFQSGD